MNAVKRELQLGIGVLIVSEILLAFGAIGLLSRMAPAIDRILQENVYSIQAAEEMMVVVALSAEEGARDRDLEGRFFGALERARDNVTLAEEPAILDRIEEGYRQLLLDPSVSRVPVVLTLGEMVAINREAMRHTRDRASRLSEAGAWAAVFMSVLAFAAGVVVAIRIQRKIVEPLDELNAVLRAYAEGNVHRRCQYRDAPPEVRELMGTVNELLDRSVELRPDAS